MIKFVKAADSPTLIKTNKVETIRKPSIKYVEMYRNTSKSPKIIGHVDTPVQTITKSKEMEKQSFIASIHHMTNPDLLQFCLFSCFLSHEEPKKIFDALKDPSWVEAMQEELLQFKIQNVWSLVDCPEGVRPIGTKWVFAPVARIEAIRLFLAYASFMGFAVYQMDVKSAFLYGTINEEVYVMQPLGFQDPEFPARVYKVEKAMYGLHQAPRAWYGTLSKYLLTNSFQRGTIDQTLFIIKHRGDFLLVQVYVDDIICGSSNPQLCREFEALMHKKFQMRVMGELNFFLGLQVLQKKDGIFLSQDKYVGDILKKFGYSNVRSANTPMDKENPWGKDGTSKDVDLHLYRSMIGSLMYITASRPDIMFAVCACARHQVTPKECHLHAVKRIFRYLKSHPKLGIWYPKDSPFDLVAYSDSDYGGATQDRKSTTRGCQFLGRRLISWQCKKQTIVSTSTTEAEYVAAASGCGQVLWIQNQLLDYGLAFSDYHNMITILGKYEHNVNFHPIVDFVEASYIRVETSDEGTKILATVDGNPRTISESSIKRNRKLNDEAGISSLPDAELFENLTLMGVNSPSFSGRTVPLFDSMLVHQGEGSGTPTEPHQTRSPEAQQSPPTAHSLPSLPPVTTESIPTDIPTETPSLRQYTRRARIAQSLALPTAADEPASPLGDVSQGEACLTVSGLEAEQDRANLIKSSTLPHDSTPRVTSLAVDKGTQDLEIASLKARIKMLEDKDGGVAEPSGEDVIIKGRSLETGEEAAIEKSTERGSNDTEELVNVLTSLDAASILTSGVQVVSVPSAAEVATVSVPTGSEKMVESDTPKKKKLQEQIDVQVAREMEEQIAREDQRMNDQIARDAEIARIHAEEELQMLIDGLDRNNETVAKYLQEYEQFAEDLSIGERIELINDLKTKHFKAMSLEEIREKFIPVWKQIEDCVHMGSKEEGERVKRKGLGLEQESAKKVKTSEEVSEEDLKIMMQLVPVEELWTLVKETLSIRQATSNKEKELWVELKRLYEPDVEDQLDQEIFMLVEKDYPLRKGLAIVMISNKLQVENYSQMANDLIMKIYKIANSIPTASDEFPLPKEFPTASEERFPLLRHYTRRARIAQSSALPPVADEPASPLRDVSQGKACPTNSGFEADQDRANIAKTSTLPSDSAPRFT
nr:hypothetical protein [Tanacetum cinerariifolium]